MENLNPVVYLTKANTFEFGNKEIPEPNPDEVLLMPASVGICGSDVHYWDHLRCGPFVIDFEKDGPLILGHESSAVVKKVGSNVTNLQPGDKVCIEPGIPCQKCTICIEGKYNLCKQMAFHATPPYNGTFQKYMTHLDEAALIEPLSVAVHACQRGGVGPGSHCLITGAGPIGIVCIKVARACGATKIVITDLDQKRLDYAQKVGADLSINIQGKKQEDIVEILEQQELSHAFECSGFDSAISLAIYAVQPGGKIMTIGRSANPNQNIPLHLASDKEIDIIGSFRYRGSYKKGLELVESGIVTVKDMITHEFQLKDIQKAFETSKNAAQTGALKVIIRVNEFNN